MCTECQQYSAIGVAVLLALSTIKIRCLSAFHNSSYKYRLQLLNFNFNCVIDVIVFGRQLYLPLQEFNYSHEKLSPTFLVRIYLFICAAQFMRYSVIFILQKNIPEKLTKGNMEESLVIDPGKYSL